MLFRTVCALLGLPLVTWALLKKVATKNLDLNETYNKFIPPGLAGTDNLATGNPTNVSVQLFITDLYDVDVNEMDFSITCFLHQSWNDPRLKFENRNLTLQLRQEEIDQLWTPDTFFPHSKEGIVYSVTTPNALLHIQHDGTVTYSLRLQLKLSCTMDFQFYPFDKQTCTVQIESYGLSSKEIKYSWKERNPVVVKNLNLPLYRMGKTPTTSAKSCHNQLFVDGFSCLDMTVHLDRAIGFYMIEVFIPDMLIVTLSWISFWLHPLAVPGRVSLGVVTVLTMTSQSSASRRSAPRVSYIKGIDVWSLFQIFFVFAAMVEFAFVNFLARLKTTEERATVIATEAKPNCGPHEDIQDHEKDEQSPPHIAKAMKIDRICRAAFPIAYLVFNFMFWVIITSVS